MQETLYIGQWHLSPLQSRHLGTSHSSPSCHQLPTVISWTHWQSKISSFSKVILVLGKARSRRVPNLGCRGAESSGWFDVSPKKCTRGNAGVGALSWWSCQSPVAHGCGLLNHLNTFCRGMFKINIKFDADSLLYLLSHFECDGPTVHMFSQGHLPPPLTITVKSSLFTHTQSSTFSLATRLHQCHTNCSHYVNYGWTFSGQTSYCYPYIK